MKEYKEMAERKSGKGVKEKIALFMHAFIRNLNKFIKEYRVQILQGIPALVIFLLATYRLSEVGQPILFNDEIGYWSNSAFFMGIDWTSVTGQISYYSYGYSLLLIPLRVLSSLFSWSSDMLYHAAVMMNGGFLVASYVIALRLAGRYLPELNRIVRTAACCVIFVYSSYIVYAHITWTECTLVFFFWLFLYVMMRVTDRSSIGNHIAFAIVSFYLYTVHQRALGIIVTAMVVVLYMRLQRLNRMRDVTVFLGSMYLYSLIHAMIKGNLQHVNYLGEAPVGVSVILGYALTGRSLIVLTAGVLLLIFLYLLDRKKYKTILLLLAAGIALTAGYLYLSSGADPMAVAGGAQGTGAVAETVDHRISTNDFSGQWGVVKNIFTGDGLIRLGISITGKWFYLTSTSGFVICWGIWGLFRNAFTLLGANIRRSEGAREIRRCRDRIWLAGVLAAWLSTFMISALYKEGLYKNDDLFNGRYIEFAIGFILLYSLNCLINDKKWVRTALIYMVLYIAAGRLCQYTVDELQRTEFELAHCVMFGRVFWNYAVPVGKVRELEGYIFPLGIAFLIVLKLARERIPRATVVRTVLALMIPLAAWSYLGRTIVDRYVVVRNEKQAEPFPQFATWINVLGSDQKVYYILDSANQRYPGALQYMLQDKPVTVVWLSEVPFTENAFYVVRQSQADAEAITDHCEVIMRSRGYVLLINKD
ncbi:MAG: hypothetical protein HDR18_00085 [Lachnospiraceae bacterium]|nr:hypothetical protein [Lachnospiraceae bacterium]